jgi:hypothetical protein
MLTFDISCSSGGGNAGSCGNTEYRKRVSTLSQCEKARQSLAGFYNFI